MRLALFVMAACVLGANAQFVFRPCGGNNDLEVSSVNVEPGVIVIPGNIKLSFAGKVNKGFNNADLKLDIFRKGVIGEIKMPCLFNFGSCNYPDLCTILDRMERENWASLGAKLAQTIKKLIGGIQGADTHMCPFKPIEASVNSQGIDLPPVPPILALIASGKYRARAEITNRDTKQLMSCFELELELRKAD